MITLATRAATLTGYAIVFDQPTRTIWAASPCCEARMTGLPYEDKICLGCYKSLVGSNEEPAGVSLYNTPENIRSWTSYWGGWTETLVEVEVSI